MAAMRASASLASCSLALVASTFSWSFHHLVTQFLRDFDLNPSGVFLFLLHPCVVILQEEQNAWPTPLLKPVFALLSLIKLSPLRFKSQLKNTCLKLLFFYVGWFVLCWMLYLLCMNFWLCSWNLVSPSVSFGLIDHHHLIELIYVILDVA